MYRRPESEHYKVPKNKPVEYNVRNGGARHHHPGLIMGTDSDHSSSVYHANRHFGSSSRMVKDGGRRELDREGRTIRRDRGRTYSGCSTSPDREGSPDRSTTAGAGGPGPGTGYSRPRPPARSYSNMHQPRSPSTSPTRPPRSRSSPGRELIANVVRRVTSRGVERHPSNRASAASRSPFKVGKNLVVALGFNLGYKYNCFLLQDIQRVHNNLRRETSGDRLRAATQHHHQQQQQQQNGRVLNYDDSEERLARFTEYRGAADEGAGESASRMNGVHRRGSSAYDAATTRHQREQQAASEELLSARERGRSLPPGANIDGMRDFYKSSQFKSMYALPPSPSRPAPVLDRAPSASTLRRDAAGRRAVRTTRVSISEGEVTDGNGVQQHQSRRPQPPARRPSTKRQAPSPPGFPRHHQGQTGLVRRVVSSDREDRRQGYHHNRGIGERRVVSSDRERGGGGGLQHPPQRRPRPDRRTSLGDALDSSYSESEGFLGDPEQVRGKNATVNITNKSRKISSPYYHAVLLLCN